MTSKISGTCLSKDASVIKCSCRSDQFSRDVSHIVENALFCSVGEFFLKFLDWDPDVDDFQSLISSCLSKDTSLVKFS